MVCRLVLAVSIIAGTALVPVSGVSAASPFADTVVSRYGGTDRYATSLLVAEAIAADAGGRLDWVVLVSGRSWTDAVVAAPLAGLLEAPVLTTPGGRLRSDATEFLRGAGVSDALIVGAEHDADGVGGTVETQLQALGISVERITRPDHYATAVAVARRLGTPGDMKGLGRTAVVASGEVFVDSLVAGAFAARGIHPILLTKPDSLRRDVADFLIDTSIEHVVLMGGTSALHREVEESIAALGINVTRLAGDTRYDTAVAAAELIQRRYGLNCFGRAQVGLARADVPFDAFSAAPLLARLCAPLLLADRTTVPIITRVFLDEARWHVASEEEGSFAAHVMGGSAAITSRAVNTHVVGTPSDRAKCQVSLSHWPKTMVTGVDRGRPAWSPDCSRIAYVDSGVIWTAGSDGSDRRQLAAGRQPSWSPDGRRIAFARVTDRVQQGEYVAHLHVVDVESAEETQITDAASQDAAPKWSPDGRRILFRRLDLRSRAFPADGSGNRYLVVADADGDNQSEIEYSATHDDSHGWMYDGERIFVRDFSSLATLRLDGTDWSPVWPVNLSDIQFSSHAWSPDRTRIALVTSGGTDSGKWKTSIKVIHLDDSQIIDVVSHTRPLHHSVQIHAPSWLPDGSGIAYVLEETIPAAMLHLNVVRVRTP